MTTVGIAAVSDLNGEFPSGCQNQSQRTIGHRFESVIRQMVQNRQHKGSGLAGSCLSTAQHVLPFQCHRQGLLLNRRRKFVAFVLNRLLQRGDQVELLKI